MTGGHPRGTEDLHYNLEIILAEPNDVSHNSNHNRSYYWALAQKVKQYYLENSYGKIFIDFKQIYDNNGSWYKLSKTHQEYASNDIPFVREAEQLALGTTAIPTNTILVIVHAGASRQEQLFNRDSYIETHTYVKPVSPNGNEIIVSENDNLGAWVHEIGHDLGSMTVNSATPDLYRMGNVWSWDLMAAGSHNGGFGCNIVGHSPVCDGTNPPHMSSYTKEFLQLLKYRNIENGVFSSYWVDLLPQQGYGGEALRYVHSKRSDGTPDTYYIIETRNPDSRYSRWDTSVPDKEIVLYWVDTKGLPRYGTYINNISQTINQVAVIQPPGLFKTSEYFDAANMITFKVVEEFRKRHPLLAKAGDQPSSSRPNVVGRGHHRAGWRGGLRRG